MANPNFFRKLITKSFIEEAKLPAETRTKFNLKNILWIFGGALVLVILVICLYTPDDSKRKVAPPNSVPDYSRPSSTGTIATGSEVVGRSNSAHPSQFGGGGIGYGGANGAVAFSGGGAGRNRNANQVIKRGANGSDPGAQIPIGTMIGARFLTAVRSVNSGSPVVAQITQEVLSDNGTSIPVNTKVIGSASFDEGSHRIQMRFNTLVYEDGSQHAIQAVAMMQDGSAGLEGDYHSGRTEQQIGKFIGNFVGGLAAGMQTTTTPGAFGSATQTGSVRNGILNGISLSAQDEAKTYSDDLANQKPSMAINAGAPFFIFLEKEYLP